MLWFKCTHASECLMLINISCFIPARPQGKSYLFFTQFKAELKGTKVEYANAYVSTKPTNNFISVYVKLSDDSDYEQGWPPVRLKEPVFISCC